MKNSILLNMIVVSFLSLAVLSPVLAQTTAEDPQLEEVINETDQEATTPEGQNNVTEKLMNRFNVTEERVNQLRDQGMGYGEINIALGLADQLEGGITDENVQQVMDLRNGDAKMGWGNVAKELDLNVGKVVSKTKNADYAAPTTTSATDIGASGRNKPKTQVKAPSLPKRPSVRGPKPPKIHRGKK